MRSSYSVSRSGAVVALLLSLTGCAGHSGSASADTSPTGASRLEVVNRSASDMDIFLLHAGQRIRLGIAPSSETTRFTLSAALVIGAGQAQFQAVPISGNSPPVLSERLKIGSGAVITFDVPPP